MTMIEDAKTVHGLLTVCVVFSQSYCSLYNHLSVISSCVIIHCCID